MKRIWSQAVQTAWHKTTPPSFSLVQGAEPHLAPGIFDGGYTPAFVKQYVQSPQIRHSTYTATLNTPLGPKPWVAHVAYHEGNHSSPAYIQGRLATLHRLAQCVHHLFAHNPAFVQRCKELTDYTLYWVTCPHKKHATHKTLGPEHVNTGYTLFMPGHEHIVLYRQEEVEKVFTHELVHLMLLDDILLPYSQEQRLKAWLTQERGFDIRSSRGLGLKEMITDTLAIDIWTHAYVLMNKQTNKKSPSYAKAISRQTQHMIQQAAKALSLQNFACVWDCAKPAPFQEHSHVFSYYVAKSALAFSYNDMYALWVNRLLKASDNGSDQGLHVVVKALLKRPWEKALQAWMKKPMEDLSMRMNLF